MIKGKNYRQIVFTSATSIDTWIEPGFEKASTKKAWTPRSSGIDSLHWVPVLWVPAGYWRPSVKYNYLLRDRRPPPYRFTDRQEYIGSTRHWINMHWLLDRLLDRVCGLKPGIEPWHWVPVLTPGWLVAGKAQWVDSCNPMVGWEALQELIYSSSRGLSCWYAPPRFLNEIGHFPCPRKDKRLRTFCFTLKQSGGSLLLSAGIASLRSRLDLQRQSCSPRNKHTSQEKHKRWWLSWVIHPWLTWVKELNFALSTTGFAYTAIGANGPTIPHHWGL